VQGLRSRRPTDQTTPGRAPKLTPLRYGALALAAEQWRESGAVVAGALDTNRARSDSAWRHGNRINACAQLHTARSDWITISGRPNNKCVHPHRRPCFCLLLHTSHHLSSTSISSLKIQLAYTLLLCVCSEPGVPPPQAASFVVHRLFYRELCPNSRPYSYLSV
jgi:hypothetical protein